MGQKTVKKAIKAPCGQNFALRKILHGSTLRLHETGEVDDIFERLKVRVWDLEKAGPNLHP